MDITRVLGVFRVADRTERLMPDELGKAQHRIQRRTQLMAHIGQKPRFRTVRALRLIARLGQIDLCTDQCGDVGGGDPVARERATGIEMRFARDGPEEIAAVGRSKTETLIAERLARAQCFEMSLCQA